MRGLLKTLALCFTALLLLSACGGGGPRLLKLGTPSASPDEFSVLPGKPLQLPGDMQNLPEPTPGNRNLADPSPRTDAIAALGGRAAATPLTGVPASDASVLAYATRNGVDADARAASTPRRAGGGLLQRWFGASRIFGGQVLDPYSEIDRLRAAGIQTPSAPPRP